MWKSSPQPHKSTQEPWGIFKAHFQDKPSCLDMPQTCPGTSCPHKPRVPRGIYRRQTKHRGLTKKNQLQNRGGGAEPGAEKLLEFLGIAWHPDVPEGTEQCRAWVWCPFSPGFTRFPSFPLVSHGSPHFPRLFLKGPGLGRALGPASLFTPPARPVPGVTAG